MGEKQKELDSLNEALALNRAIENSAMEAKTLNSIAGTYLSMGEPQQALDSHNKALDIQRRLRLRPEEAKTLKDMAQVYSSLGDYKQSLKTSEQALEIFEQLGDRNTKAITLNIMCNVSRKAEDYQQALNYCNSALNLSQEQRYFLLEQEALVGLVKVYELSKDYPNALYNAKRLELLASQQNNNFHKGSALFFLSRVYLASGEYQKALNSSKEGLSAWQGGFPLGEANSLGYLGKIYNSLKQPQQAIETYNQQLALWQKLANKAGEADTLYNLALTERDRGNLQDALTQIQTTIQIVESIRTKVTSEDLRTSYFATVQDYYKFYIDLLMQLHKKDPSKGYDAEALHISERSRARSLIELLTEAHADIRKGVDPKLLAEEKRLRWKLDAQVKLLPELLSNKEAQAAAQKEIDNLLSQQKELQTKIRISSPKFARLQYPDPERDILKLPQIQQQLDKDTLLLQYSLGKERSYLWAVTPNSINSYELPGREAIETSAGKFKELLRKCQKPGIDCQKLPAEQKAKDFQEITQAATELSQLILAPVSAKLGKKRLVIVADGVLEEIPFTALSEPNQISQLEKSPQTGKSNYQPLLVYHEIVNLPSVTAIATHREDLNKRQAAPKTLAVLADPVFAANDDRFTGKPPTLGPELNLEQSSLQQSARNLNRAGWGRLLGTRTEAEQILKLVPASESLYAFDFDANYNLATSPKLKQYRFILFATHGFADPINPESSGIVLSQINKEGKPNLPSILRLRDIFNLDLDADLVVLSACETGLGKDVQGEGLVGLTRGLMYAGAKSAVVSLWQVNDTATSQLMPQFYTAMLQQKASPTTALREAQLKLWQQENWRNPYYWAAFTLQGEWR
ncbi:CHAT domain-containing tetratricopeptide repeat protein [Nostoc sp.]|uniref:CHAT domain-containing tetratricopeptide repeat protein n=1 Tax=Nostoc sp. TaxID=1180 RepID=UPI003FA60E10